ncbi:hypothetical protein NDU88_003272 [Pleurodeles waltl]|uniref:Uncharacterized protein n=1 Tax=Pleurodeles waltl TaxID=8319 RepID=A0AAV7KV49_PLEWA|nr:hypothetical protein NDU88_003272 [Pleurodeles waltl]
MQRRRRGSRAKGARDVHRRRCRTTERGARDTQRRRHGTEREEPGMCKRKDVGPKPKEEEEPNKAEHKVKGG